MSQRRPVLRRLPIVIGAAVLIGMSGPAGAQEGLGPGGTFHDDDSSVHEADIEALAASDITRGCNPPLRDRFCPERVVTRGEMAAFLVRALDLPPSTGDAFIDDEESVFAGDIQALSAAGVTRGCDPPANQRFCPDDPVTRGQMAAFLARGYALAPAAIDRFDDTASSVFRDEIARLAEAGITFGCDPPANDRFCPRDPVTREQMASFLVRAEGLEPIPAPDPVGMQLELVADGLAAPVHAASPPGDERLFVVEKPGRIRIVVDGEVAHRPFLDISSRVRDGGGEMGLLSMAFHPDYGSNGRFFVAYSGPLRSGGSGHHTEYLSEFTVSPDPDVATASERVVLAVDQPASNHNGGHLLFGPDGMLYVALGDGGGGGDPFENGQDVDTLLGSILRIDVDGMTPYEVPDDNPFVGRRGADEIWVYGLRNPWRIWFDGESAYVADVGQSAREEVTVIGRDDAGSNLGWDVLEGTACFEPSSGCDRTGKVEPLVELRHSEGACSITGGVVYRGSAIPQLRGRYLFVDLCQGRIQAIATDGSRLIERNDLTSQLGRRSGVWSFGVDGSGEVVLTVGGDGSVWKIAAR